MAELKYDIPKKVVRKGVMNGITGKDLAYAGGLICIGVALLMISGTFGVSTIIGIICLAICAGVGVFFVIPLSNKENMLIKIRRWRQYNTRAKRYYYKRYTG